jgi:ubiquitin-protein ligase
MTSTQPTPNSTTTTTSYTHTKRNAIRRLMSDLEDWRRNSIEFPSINALPLETDIFEWHCNLASNGGKFAGIVLHLILKFADSYPNQAPDVKICTKIPHPNVFDDWICLDMIRTTEQGKYKGWTPAYNITSILMQLQSFLFEESNIDQDGGYSTKNGFIIIKKRYIIQL